MASRNTPEPIGTRGSTSCPRLRADTLTNDETDYIADPHTAVALQGAQRLKKEKKLDGPVVVVSTADPAKFADTVQAATGRKLSTSEKLSELAHRKKSVVDIPAAPDALQSIMNESK